MDRLENDRTYLGVVRRIENFSLLIFAPQLGFHVDSPKLGM